MSASSRSNRPRASSCRGSVHSTTGSCRPSSSPRCWTGSSSSDHASPSSGRGDFWTSAASSPGSRPARSSPAPPRWRRRWTRGRSSCSARTGDGSISRRAHGPRTSTSLPNARSESTTGRRASSIVPHVTVPPPALHVREDSGPVATDADIARAVEALRTGGLVAFPTETVYGLGADAANVDALARLYAVKGRPRSHPVIVHIGAREILDDWGASVPDTAYRLAGALWPGPLTIVVRRAARVPDAVTGGGGTVGVRVPDQPVALAMLRAFGGGVAAPSANRF